MYLPEFEIHEAATLEDAAQTLARHAPNARLLAGGTDLLVDLKTGRIRVSHLVSVNRIASLRGVSGMDGALRIGALTTITELDRSEIVRERFSPLLDATGKMAARQIRNVATVGGNIASAVPCADLPPILIAMHASVTLWSAGGERDVPLDRFFVGARQTIVRDDEVLLAVRVPGQPARFGAAYARFQLRDGNAIAVASVAASLELDRRGAIDQARVVLGAVAPVPKLVESAGAALVGRTPDQEAFQAAGEIAMESADPISDVRGSAEFRRKLVAVLTPRALSTALARIKEKR